MAHFPEQRLVIEPRTLSALALAYAPARLTDCRGGGGEAGQPLESGMFGQFSLAGNRVAALHFLAGNHVGEIKSRKNTKEEATKCEESLKRSRGRGRRENFNVNLKHKDLGLGLSCYIKIFVIPHRITCSNV